MHKLSIKYEEKCTYKEARGVVQETAEAHGEGALEHLAVGVEGIGQGAAGVF
jgi:hypothetical protein